MEVEGLEVRKMTTIQTGPEVTVPEVLTEEHHEAIRASWELPAYERQSPPTARSTKPVVVGILAGAVSLAVGFGAGYWAHSQMVETAAPIVISRAAGMVDSNGMTLGRRLAPLETALPTAIALAGPVDANGAPLGRRVPPFETQSPSEVPAPAVTDANGMTLGRRLPPSDELATTQAPVTEADTVAFGRHGARP
jgi:hypothetical protein